MYKIEIYEVGNYKFAEFASHEEAIHFIDKLYLKQVKNFDKEFYRILFDDKGFAILGKHNHVWYSVRISR